ncbi:hypothetical protein KQH56_03010 [bacterium]|nr:hypothetical protein [bacterium]
MLWITFEIIVRRVAQKGIETDFYGGILRTEVKEMQARWGLKSVIGSDWLHLGWIADPEREYYRIEYRHGENSWSSIGEASYGSWLGKLRRGAYRVIAVSKSDGLERELGCVENNADEQQTAGFARPEIDSEWQPLFRPEGTGRYVNDHCFFPDKGGVWRLLGITSQTRGDYRQERYFASASGKAFPPKHTYLEDTKVADYGTLAWAPDVIKDDKTFHLFWSPHQLHHMESEDGVKWHSHKVILEKPMHPFFRDAMVFNVAPDQWLLYATGRGKWFSRIDIYQSFDLVHWQYIRPAIWCGWGSEKNFVTGSMESPCLLVHGGNYYLSTTYNNDSFFWTALLLEMGIILNRKDYNNTLIFGSHNPYDFGRYHGQQRADQLVGKLETHAPVYVQRGDQWYLTTCGWPFVTTLTEGEVAWAEFIWKEF